MAIVTGLFGRSGRPFLVRRGLRTALGLASLLLLLLLLPPGHAWASTSVVATISPGCGPSGIAANPVTNKIYVANSVDGNVAVIDGNTNTVLTLIPLVTFTATVAVNTVTNKIYVAHYAVGTGTTVRVINGATDTVLGSIP